MTGTRRILNPAAYEAGRLARQVEAEHVACPKCGAARGVACVEQDGRRTAVAHGARCSAARPEQP